MQPYTIYRSARETWTSTPVYFGGREFRRVRFSNGVRITWAVWARKSPSVMTGTLISRRAA